MTLCIIGGVKERSARDGGPAGGPAATRSAALARPAGVIRSAAVARSLGVIRSAALARSVAKAVRDGALRHVPGLQGLVRAAALRGVLPPRVWRRLHPVGPCRLHAPDGTPFQYVPCAHDGLARHVVWTDLRDWEPGTHTTVFRLARGAGVFVDVGAYSGLYTVLACLADPRLRAVAFEPNPVKLPQLARNVAVNGLRDRVRIVGRALGESGGRATLAIPSDDSTASLRAGRAGERTVEVEVSTGDAELLGLPVGLIKIDVEGREAEVLAGMAGLLRARRPYVVAECLEPEALERVWRTVSALGYRHVYHLGPDGPEALDTGDRRGADPDPKPVDPKAVDPKAVDRGAAGGQAGGPKAVDRGAADRQAGGRRARRAGRPRRLGDGFDRRHPNHLFSAVPLPVSGASADDLPAGEVPASGAGRLRRAGDGFGRRRPGRLFAVAPPSAAGVRR